MATAAIPLASSVVQSPSVEDLLSARSKRSVPVQSFYSTFTIATELDLPEAARLAMREEAENGLWSPSMDSAVSDDDGQVAGHHIGDEHEIGLETPTMSESQYSSRSRSPSMASIKTAALVRGGAASAIDVAAATLAHSDTSPKRLLNTRNLQINTALSTVHAYPQQLTTPSAPSGRSAQIEVSPAPLTSRSLPGNVASITTTTLVAPLSAIPRHVNRPRRRSSLDSLSTLASPTLGDDDSLGVNQASLQRMQSFLGPKMKHISPAPWNNENDASSDYNTSESSFWNDDDPEIGSVHMATKTPRSRSMKEALGLATSGSIVKPDTAGSGTLKGLGFAMAASSPARAAFKAEQSTKARTMTASSDTSMYTGKARFKGFLSRSESRDIMASPPPPVPSHTVMTVSNITRSKSPESSGAQPTSILSDLQSMNREPHLEIAARSTTPTVTASLSKRRSLSNIETTAGKLAEASTLSSSTPVGAEALQSAVAQIAEASLQQTSTAAVSLQARRAAAPVRKRPPILTQDEVALATTSQSVNALSIMSDVPGAIPIPGGNSSSPAMLPSLTVLAAPGNGMKLVSLDVARDRERAKSPSPTPVSPDFPLTSSLPPSQSTAAPAAPKVLKSKKSGFLKLFKYKEDLSAPAVPRGSLDDLPSPTVSLQGNRSVSSPTDFRRGEALTAPPPRAVPMALSHSSQPMTKARSDTGDSATLVIKQPPTSIPLAEATRRANVSAPPGVTLIQPTASMTEHPLPSSTPNTALPVPPAPNVSKAKRTFVDAQQGLVPSLSLRPVSMMFSSMPQAFLADLQAAETKMPTMGSSVGSLGLPSPTAARTPDTPSFVFFDSDNVVTPPAVNSATEASKAPFGLPTPPHSASSARTGYPGLPKPPSSPSLAHKESLNAASSAAYRSRILVLEKHIAVLQARLASAGQAGPSVEIAEQSDLEAMSKAAGKVSGPSAKLGNAS